MLNDEIQNQLERKLNYLTLKMNLRIYFGMLC